MKHLGDKIKVVAGVLPVDSGAATLTSADITRDKNYEEGKAIFQVGTPSGTPDSFTATCKVKHKELAGDNYVDFATGLVLSASGGIGTLDLDLKGAKSLLQMEIVLAFVNGTSPKIEAASCLVYGEPKIV